MALTNSTERGQEVAINFTESKDGHSWKWTKERVVRYLLIVLILAIVFLVTISLLTHFETSTLPAVQRKCVKL